jgi:uncharacterized cupin superfamily protein
MLRDSEIPIIHTDDTENDPHTWFAYYASQGLAGNVRREDLPALHEILTTTDCKIEDDDEHEISANNPTQKINTHQLAEEPWTSPKGRFSAIGKQVSEALGRQPQSNDLLERHPFDIEISRIPPGKTNYPFHSHSAQWEFYHVISGRGIARDKDGNTPIEPGDAFLFKPGEPHQIINDSEEDLVLYVVADNPIGESCHYPDSNKWLVRSPERRLVRSEPLEYFDGEE